MTIGTVGELVTELLKYDPGARIAVGASDQAGGDVAGITGLDYNPAYDQALVTIERGPILVQE